MFVAWSRNREWKWRSRGAKKPGLKAGTLFLSVFLFVLSTVTGLRSLLILLMHFFKLYYFISSFKENSCSLPETLLRIITLPCVLHQKGSFSVHSFSAAGEKRIRCQMTGEHPVNDLSHVLFLWLLRIVDAFAWVSLLLLVQGFF